MPAVSKRQQRYMGMVHAVQKGDMKAPSKSVAETAKSISPTAATEFASTKTKGLPTKKSSFKMAGIWDQLGLASKPKPTMMQDIGRQAKENIGGALGVAGGGLGSLLGLDVGARKFRDFMGNTASSGVLDRLMKDYTDLDIERQLGQAARRGQTLPGGPVDMSFNPTAVEKLREFLGKSRANMIKAPIQGAKQVAKKVTESMPSMSPIRGAVGNISSGMKLAPEVLGATSPMAKKLLGLAAHPRTAIAGLLGLVGAGTVGGGMIGEKLQKYLGDRFSKKSSAQLALIGQLVKKSAVLAEKPSLVKMADYIDCMVIMNPNYGGLLKVSQKLRERKPLIPAFQEAYPHASKTARAKVAARLVTNYLRTHRQVADLNESLE